MTFTAPYEGAVVVSNIVVEIELRVHVIAFPVADLGVEDVAVLEGDVLGTEVKVRHDGVLS